ncbi:MAG: hypothetical protein MUF02_00810 [Acidobacteria bacterium]|nr:hypothetical protein [Acidobacteriota bacterium]
MKHSRVVFVLVLSLMVAGMTFAARDKNESATGTLTQKNILQRYGFIDENGDGINDLARDSDNDGIPNCVDSDWARPQDGSGYMNRFGHMHQNANHKNGGLNNYSYSHQWKNMWSNSNPDFCNQNGSNGGTNPHQRSNRGN